MIPLEKFDYSGYSPESIYLIDLARRASSAIAQTRLPTGLDRVILFGSVVRNEATEESDADLAVLITSKLTNRTAVRYTNAVKSQLRSEDIPVVDFKWMKAKRVDITIAGSLESIEKWAQKGHRIDRDILNGVVLYQST